MAPQSPSTDRPLPVRVYLEIAVALALLGGGFVVAFVARDDGPALGFGLVCLGSAAFAGWTYPSVRRSHSTHGRGTTTSGDGRHTTASDRGFTVGTGNPGRVR